MADSSYEHSEAYLNHIQESFVSVVSAVSVSTLVEINEGLQESLRSITKSYYYALPLLTRAERDKCLPEQEEENLTIRLVTAVGDTKRGISYAKNLILDVLDLSGFTEFFDKYGMETNELFPFTELDYHIELLRKAGLNDDWIHTFVRKVDLVGPEFIKRITESGGLRAYASAGLEQVTPVLETLDSGRPLGTPTTKKRRWWRKTLKKVGAGLGLLGGALVISGTLVAGGSQFTIPSAIASCGAGVGGFAWGLQSLADP